MSDKFEYKYTAPSQSERKEIESIRNQYLPKTKDDNKLERLRSLDSKVKNIPVALGISIGVIGMLIFGTGMTFFLEWVNYWYIGIPFVIIGTLAMLLCYPIFTKIQNNLKNKYGEEIVNLANELMDENL